MSSCCNGYTLSAIGWFVPLLSMEELRDKGVKGASGASSDKLGKAPGL